MSSYVILTGPNVLQPITRGGPSNRVTVRRIILLFPLFIFLLHSDKLIIITEQ